MNKKILLFSVNEEQQEKIKMFCDSLSIEVKAVEPDGYDKPISSIVGIPKTKTTVVRRSQGNIRATNTGSPLSYRTTGFPEPMMVFCNLIQDDLDQFLSGYAAAGIEKVPLKAILTPHNISWTPEQLFDELMAEHKAMTQKK